MIRSVSVRAVSQRRKRGGRPLAMVGSLAVLTLVGFTLYRMGSAAPSDSLADEIAPLQSNKPTNVAAAQPQREPIRERPKPVVASKIEEQPLQPRKNAAEMAPSLPDAPDPTAIQPDAVTDPLTGDLSEPEAVLAGDIESSPLVQDAQTRTMAAGASDNTAITAARQLIADGHWLEARKRLMRLLDQDLTSVEHNEVRALLQQVANETIFSKHVIDDDPLVTTYTIQSGDRLAKIAPRYGIPFEIIMRINGIKSANRIRAGQKIKIPRGPFNAKIDTSDFRLDLYLQDTYLRSYRVALGRGSGTPLGTWKVTECLENPRYYPSESATEKRVIPGGVPENPLGTRWIGLEGTAGDAVGKEGFGIHGTNEPDSIGNPVSLGCVRLRNEDVEFVYSTMRAGKSIITTTP